MTQYDNDMQVILEKVTSDHPKAPPYRVKVEVGGQKYQAGLWLWTKKDGTKVTDKHGNGKYKGTLEIDTYQAEQAMQDQSGAGGGLPDEDGIPF